MDPTDHVPEFLICPICMDIPKRKVFQCTEGHTICEECHFQVATCPQCRIPFGDHPIRALAIEMMLENLNLGPSEESVGATGGTYTRRSPGNQELFCCSNLARSLPSHSGPQAQEGDINELRNDLFEQLAITREHLLSNTFFTFKTSNDRVKFAEKLEKVEGVVNHPASTLEQIQQQIRSLRIWVSAYKR